MSRYVSWFYWTRGGKRVCLLHEAGPVRVAPGTGRHLVVETYKGRLTILIGYRFARFLKARWL